MRYFLLLIVLCCLIEYLHTCIVINKAVVRTPKDQDIGLIFDVNVSNDQSKKKEMLEFQVHAADTCCLNLSQTETVTGFGRIVGGNFGYIEGGGCKTISLMWPTVSVYNRVGYCPIVITSTNVNGEETILKHVLHFDTRFVTLDPDSHTIRKHKDFTDCHNWDLDYFKNCTPVDCEERYFGRRSYFNCDSQRCECTAQCTEPNQFYDMFANECVDIQNFATEEDLEDIQAGKYDDNVMDFSCGNRKCNNITAGPNIVVNEITNANNPFDDMRPTKNRHTRENDFSIWKMNFSLPYWLSGVLNGLLIVFATVAIYVLICFIIFLIVSCVSRRSSHMGMKTQSTSHSNSSLPITSSSLMSQR